MTVFADGVDILEDYRAVYDIIFLDVEMKHLDGMTTAERIRQMDADVILIFITNMAQYAIRGYSVGALDYVLKPVPYLPLGSCSRRLPGWKKRAKALPDRAGGGGGLRRLDTASIYYLKARARVHFYTDEGAIFPPPAPSRPLRKSWQTAPLPAATAATLSIWHRCGAAAEHRTGGPLRAAGQPSQAARLPLPHDRLYIGGEGS